MSDDSTTTPRLRKAVRQKLESLARAGVTHVPAAKTVERTRKVASVAPPSPAANASRLAATAESIPSDVARPLNEDSLAIIAAEVAACTRCQELADTRTQTVPGVGNPHPQLMFLGEAPGADEDRQGEPFVGRAGQLLTQMIENGMKLKRADVFIGNVLKCRPPGNRTPAPEEAANCRGFLDRQIAILKPQFICCLGAVAAQNLLGTDRAIGKLRGQLFDYHGAKVVCTYHPAYLLRNPAAKRDTWEDIQLLMKEMGSKKS